MKKLIFKKFSSDILKFFILVSISISLIVWVIQAVNFLDIVTEDGHNFKVYFLYTLFSLPKIFSKILPFIFFISLFYIILKYENNNELIIFWTIGIKKIQFINILIKFSIFYLIIQLFFTIFLVPTTMDKARSYIRSSNVDLFSSLIKEKKFIDTVKNLTIFVVYKSPDGELQNIFLKEKLKEDKNYQIIYAKKGKFDKSENKNILKLYDGRILNYDNKNSNSLKFSETELNLNKFSTKTKTFPTIQETSTFDVASCIIMLKNLSNPLDKKKFEIKKKLINCSKEKLHNSFQEIIKRIILPFYIPLLALIASLIIIKSKDDYKFTRYKILLFTIGVIIILLSEISLRYSGTTFVKNLSITIVPIFLFFLTYVFFYMRLKANTLIKK